MRIAQGQPGTMCFGDGADQTKAKSVARCCARGLETHKAFLHPQPVLPRNPKAVVLHVDGHTIGLGVDIQLNCSAWRGMAQCVLDKVDDRLREQFAVALDRQVRLADDIQCLSCVFG